MILAIIGRCHAVPQHGRRYFVHLTGGAGSSGGDDVGGSGVGDQHMLGHRCLISRFRLGGSDDGGGGAVAAAAIAIDSSLHVSISRFYICLISTKQGKKFVYIFRFVIQLTLPIRFLILNCIAMFVAANWNSS